MMNRFPKNARVCFVGDSITHGNGYIARIAAHYQQNLPQENVNFYNCGISGASAQTALDVFDIDTATYRPTHAVIFLGVNDSGRDLLAGGRSIEVYETLKENFEAYQKNMDTLCGRLLDLGAEITLCTPVPLDEYGAFETRPLPGSYALMMAYANHVRAYAKEKNLGLVDYFAYFTEVMQTETIYREDRVHPTPLGHYHLAKCFLKAQGMEIGEYGDIPAFVEEWYIKASRFRNILAAEFLKLGDYGMTAEDAVVRAQQLLDNEELNEYFVNLLKGYIALKPDEAKLRAEVTELMETKLKKV